MGVLLRESSEFFMTCRGPCDGARRTFAGIITSVDYWPGALIRARQRGNTPAMQHSDTIRPAPAVNPRWRELNAFTYLDPGFDPLATGPVSASGAVPQGPRPLAGYSLAGLNLVVAQTPT